MKLTFYYIQKKNFYPYDGTTCTSEQNSTYYFVQNRWKNIIENKVVVTSHQDFSPVVLVINQSLKGKMQLLLFVIIIAQLFEPDQFHLMSHLNSSTK